jgi:hypothetical protein
MEHKPFLGFFGRTGRAAEQHGICFEYPASNMGTNIPFGDFLRHRSSKRCCLNILFLPVLL